MWGNFLLRPVTRNLQPRWKADSRERPHFHATHLKKRQDVIPKGRNNHHSGQPILSGLDLINTHKTPIPSNKLRVIKFNEQKMKIQDNCWVIPSQNGRLVRGLRKEQIHFLKIDSYV